MSFKILPYPLSMSAGITLSGSSAVKREQLLHYVDTLNVLFELKRGYRADATITHARPRGDSENQTEILYNSTPATPTKMVQREDADEADRITTLQVSQLKSLVKKYDLNDKKIIDIPCGIGRLINVFDVYTVIDGFDITPSSVAAANKNNTSHEMALYHVGNATNISVTDAPDNIPEGDAPDKKINIQKNSRDGILEIWLQEYLSDENAKAFCVKAYDILKPGGTLISQNSMQGVRSSGKLPTEDNTTTHYRNAVDHFDHLTQAGFDILEVIPSKPHLELDNNPFVLTFVCVKLERTRI